MSTEIADRLQEALSSRDITLHALRQRLPETEPDGRRLRGRSYASLRSYTRGDTRPPIEVVRVLARALRVSEQWLMTGDGSMDPGAAVQEAGPTESRSDVWVSRGGAGEESNRDAWLRRANIENLLSGLLGASRDSAAMVALVELFRQRWFWECRHPGGEDEIQLPDDQELALMIGEAVQNPLARLGVDIHALDVRQREQYILQMATVLKSVGDLPVSLPTHRGAHRPTDTGRSKPTKKRPAAKQPKASPTKRPKATRAKKR